MKHNCHIPPMEETKITEEEALLAAIAQLSLNTADLQVEKLEIRLSLSVSGPPPTGDDGGMCGTCTTPG